MSIFKRILDEIAPRGSDPVAWAARYPQKVRDYMRRRYGICPHLNMRGPICMDCWRKVLKG